MIAEALYRWLIHERLIIITPKRISINEIEAQKKVINQIPNAIMYCDSEKCTVNLEDKPC